MADQLTDMEALQVVQAAVVEAAVAAAASIGRGDTWAATCCGAAMTYLFWQASGGDVEAARAFARTCAAASIGSMEDCIQKAADAAGKVPPPYLPTNPVA